MSCACSQSASNAVCLPTRGTPSAGPLWPVQAIAPQLDQESVASCCRLLMDSKFSNTEVFEKCEAKQNGHSLGRRESCCRDSAEPQRKLVQFNVVRDIIIGLSDGLMVPFALTAGLSSLGSAKLVSQGGFAELIAGAISMGVGGYLSAQSEQDIYRHRLSAIVHRLETACQSEVEREVYDVLRSYGIRPSVSRLVATNLRTVDKQEAANEVVVRSDKRLEESWRSSMRAPFNMATRLSGPTRGTTAFLITVGEGQEEIPNFRLFISAFTIGMSYFVGGLIPIIPYLCVSDALSGLYWSILATGITLLVFGLAKAWFTGAATGCLGLAWGGISMLAVGGAAAAASYGIVKALAGGSK